MPLIKIFMTASPSADVCERLAQEFETLCAEGIHARREDVQLALIPVAAMPRGPSVLVEVHYRARPDRTGDKMASFVRGLAASCMRHLQTQPRIRCFGVDQATLCALN